MPPARMRGDGRKAKDPKKTLLRLLGYLKKHMGVLALVMLCIVGAAVATTTGSTALGKLVDRFILPMVATGSTDFTPLLEFIVTVSCVFIMGIIATFLQSYLMVGVTQGIQKTIRDEMFTKMQALPIRYFDSNTAGNIMSRYTSDIDTLRQMISQSIPQAVSSVVTLVVIFATMLKTSWMLTIVSMITVVGVFFVTKTLAGKAGKYFIGQQKSLGAVNGYIEEMITGQKVVKVFNHEEVSKQEFDKLNNTLCENAFSAGKFANMMGPINNNLGYVQFAILAIVGGTIVVFSKGAWLSLGSLMAFMTLSRTFNQPINQISQQMNSIIMALAGAERVFDLMDQEPEVDEGYVTLVNAKIDENGNLIVTLSNGSTTDLGNMKDLATCDHKFSDWTVLYAPTCESLGINARTCSECGAVEHIYTDRLGHTLVDVYTIVSTCTQHSVMTKCTVCNAAFVEEREIAVEHDIVVDPAVDATCITDGLTEGAHCGVCGKVIVAQEVVPANGHTDVIDEAVAPDCENTGLTDGWYCNRCKTMIEEQEEIAALGHNEVIDAAVAATCENPGKTEGKHCDRCGETLTAQEIVPELGHNEVIDKDHIRSCQRSRNFQGGVDIFSGRNCNTAGMVMGQNHAGCIELQGCGDDLPQINLCSMHTALMNHCSVQHPALLIQAHQTDCLLRAAQKPRQQKRAGLFAGIQANIL